VRLIELLVGVEGLALLRHLYDGDDADAAQRLSEVGRALGDDALTAHAEPTTESDPKAGYAVWADSYDEPGNPLVAIEEPAVWQLVADLAPGRALDAACGTGRHAGHLAELGHDVVGLDLTPEMLDHARRRGTPVGEADLRALPVRSGAFDLVVCGLALAHLDDPSIAISELARALKPGGRLVLSVLHPFQAHLGWHAPFADADGTRGFVREHPHTHGDYLTALAASGMTLRACVEPVLTEREVEAKRRAFRHVPEAALAAYVGLPGALVLSADRS
jgi:SAM-dependent methyltransferase